MKKLLDKGREENATAYIVWRKRKEVETFNRR